MPGTEFRIFHSQSLKGRLVISQARYEEGARLKHLRARNARIVAYGRVSISDQDFLFLAASCDHFCGCSQSGLPPTVDLRPCGCHEWDTSPFVLRLSIDDQILDGQCGLQIHVPKACVK